MLQGWRQYRRYLDRHRFESLSTTTAGHAVVREIGSHGGPHNDTNDRERRSGYQEIPCKGVRPGLGKLLSIGAADG